MCWLDKKNLKKTAINSIKKICAEDGGNWAAAWPRAIGAVTGIVMVVSTMAGVAAAPVVVAEEMANAKQTVAVEAKTQYQLSTIKKQKNGSEDDVRSGGEAISRGWQCGDGCGGSQGNGRG